MKKLFRCYDYKDCGWVCTLQHPHEHPHGMCTDAVAMDLQCYKCVPYDPLPELQEQLDKIQSTIAELTEPDDDVSNYEYVTSDGIVLGNVGENVDVRVQDKRTSERIATGNMFTLRNGLQMQADSFLSSSDAPVVLKEYFKHWSDRTTS